jgi:outer membrane lipoprotein-sorting protein
MSFEKSTKFSFLDNIEKTNGILMFSPPNLFYYKSGDDLIISGKDKTWIYTKAEDEYDDSSVIIRKTKKDFLNILNASKNVKIEITKNKDKKLYFLDKFGEYKYIVVKIGIKNNIKEIKFIDYSDNITLIKTSTFKFTSKILPLDIFTFNIPKGTRIITED